MGKFFSTPEANDVLARNLEVLMEHRGMKQKALGVAAEIGQTTISLYLHPGNRKTSTSGKVPSAKIGEVQRLAKALRVETWQLLYPDLDPLSLPAPAALSLVAVALAQEFDETIPPELRQKVYENLLSTMTLVQQPQKLETDAPPPAAAPKPVRPRGP